MKELPKMHPATQWPESIAYKQAQQDMIAAGYRQVPSVEEIAGQMGGFNIVQDGWGAPDTLAKILHHWLLEGDKE